MSADIGNNNASEVRLAVVDPLGNQPNQVMHSERPLTNTEICAARPDVSKSQVGHVLERYCDKVQPILKKNNRYLLGQFDQELRKHATGPGVAVNGEMPVRPSKLQKLLGLSSHVISEVVPAICTKYPAPPGGKHGPAYLPSDARKKLKERAAEQGLHSKKVKHDCREYPEHEITWATEDIRRMIFRRSI